MYTASELNPRTNRDKRQVTGRLDAPMELLLAKWAAEQRTAKVQYTHWAARCELKRLMRHAEQHGPLHTVDLMTSPQYLPGLARMYHVAFPDQFVLRVATVFLTRWRK